MALFGRSGFVRLHKHSKFSYKPLYYNPEEEEKEERDGKRRIKMEKGAFFKNGNRSRLVGAFALKEMGMESRRMRSNQLIRMSLLIGMLTLPCLYIVDQLSTAKLCVGFFVLFVAFILRLNKH